MPVAAVVGAGFALASGGAAAIGAVVAGGFTLVDTFSAVAAVGSVLGAIGAVTGDKTLSTVGMVVGGIGGVGALAANAGLFGASATTESLFGSSAGDAASKLGTVAATPGSSALVSDAAAGGAAGGDSLINGAGAAAAGFMPGGVIQNTLPDLTPSASSAASAPDIINAIAAKSPGLSSPVETVTSTAMKAADTGVSGAASAAAPAAAAAADAALPSPVAPSSVAAATAPQSPTVMKDGMPDVRVPGNTYAGADGKTYVSDGTRWAAQSEGGLWNFLKTAGGGAVGMGVLQAAGSFLQGATDELKPAQAEAYRAQAAANTAAAGINQKQLANMNSNIPVATRAAPSPVTGAPRSLLNGTMVGAQ